MDPKLILALEQRVKQLQNIDAEMLDELQGQWVYVRSDSLKFNELAGKLGRHGIHFIEFIDVISLNSHGDVEDYINYIKNPGNRKLYHVEYEAASAILNKGQVALIERLFPKEEDKPAQG